MGNVVYRDSSGAYQWGEISPFQLLLHQCLQLCLFPVC